MSKVSYTSQLDKDHYLIIRENINAFLKNAASTYINESGGIVLDIAPHIHEGIRPCCPPEIEVETLDIDPTSGATYIGDVCRLDSVIRNETFDYIVCTEVLEHTMQPFHAIAEIHRILKSGGMLFLSVPFNFRIHGPLPDCWRFTEHGLRALLTDFEIIKLDSIETTARPLMPIHYTVIARKEHA